MLNKLSQIEEKFEKTEAELALPETISDQEKFRELMYKRFLSYVFCKKRICTQYYFILYEAQCQEKTEKNRIGE